MCVGGGGSSFFIFVRPFPLVCIEEGVLKGLLGGEGCRGMLMGVLKRYYYSESTFHFVGGLSGYIVYDA